MSLASAAQIGTSQAGLTPVESISVGIPMPIPQPRMRYYPERRRVKMTSRRTIGVGAPYIIWHWDFLKSEWRHALKDYLTGISTDLYIETLINSENGSTGTDAWKQFKVIGTWPEGDEEKDAGRRLSFDIEFEVVEELTPL